MHALIGAAFVAAVAAFVAAVIGGIATDPPGSWPALLGGAGLVTGLFSGGWLADSR